MPIERPTFSESWYRVAELKPRLRPAVQIHRQHYRGRMWHVLQDPSSNQFHRLNDAAYRFVAMLDGRRSIADVWKVCNEQFGDEAPTQGEAIQLLGQLYTSNLLQGELPPDAEGLFGRYRKRKTREVQGYLMNLLFVRVPLFDPNRILDRWVGVFGKIFTIPGFIVWLAIIITGLYFVVSNWSAAAERGGAQHMLDAGNLPLLYVAFALIKLLHEFGHGFACKRFGRRNGSGGDVHTIGIMFLVFTPLPYVDASSSWALRSKWQRAIVGAGGMYVELAAAAVAAIVWANTSPGPLNTICYNAMWVASVSTLLFNANPLLRYDGYYILSDLLEIPNLSQRAKQYIYHIVKRYAWGVRHSRSPAHTRGERGWFFFYGIASTIYRFFICFRILLFVADKFFVVGAVLAAVAAVAWVLVPLGKFVHYLAVSPELSRVRPRAVGSTLATLAGLVWLLGLMPMADRSRADGIVQAEDKRFVHAVEGGRMVEFLPSGTPVQRGTLLLRQEDRWGLEEQRQMLELRLERLGVERQRALEVARARRQDEATAVQIVDQQTAAVREELMRLEQRLAELTIFAPTDGLWISPDIEFARDGWIQPGTQVGLVADIERPIIRVMVSQDQIAMLVEEIDVRGNDDARRVEVRVKGRPDLELRGVIVEIPPAGTDQLPSPALGVARGGSVTTRPDDQRGLRATERLFEVRVRPDAADAARVRLLEGQRVGVRFEMPHKPLMTQWVRSLRQLVQQRFGG